MVFRKILKLDKTMEKYRARLVANTKQRECIFFNPCSLVTRITSINNYRYSYNTQSNLRQMDVKIVFFLNGDLENKFSAPATWLYIVVKGFFERKNIN